MINCNRTAIYMRLSKDDGDKEESESITNQRKLINRYAEGMQINIFKEYVDDGYSGSNFDRPAFRKMLNDIENGIIDSIIVKDLSRFARESIRASEYIEKYFPTHNIRFISILDDIDTYLDNLSNEFIEFKLFSNQKMLRETSKKLRQSKKSNMLKGMYTATYPAYGYKKDKNNVGKLIVDEEVKPIVKKIFELYLDGKGSSFIAKYLTCNKVKTPAQHIGIIPYKSTDMYSIWKSTQVIRILKNEVYIGNTVRNVENKIIYNKKGKRKTSKNEWIITKDTHEPIISKEDFYKVQEIIKSKNGKKINLKYNFLLRPFMYCAKCGRKVNFNVRSKNLVDINCPKAHLNLCEHFYYNYFKIEKEILEKIKDYYMNFFDFSNMEEHIIYNKVESFNSKIKKETNLLSLQIKKINSSIDELYMRRLDNKVDEYEYQEIMTQYTNEREEIKNKISEYNILKENFNDQTIFELKEVLERNNKEFCNEISQDVIKKLILKIEISKEKIEVKYRFRPFF